MQFRAYTKQCRQRPNETVSGRTSLLEIFRNISTCKNEICVRAEQSSMASFVSSQLPKAMAKAAKNISRLRTPGTSTRWTKGEDVDSRFLNM